MVISILYQFGKFLPQITSNCVEIMQNSVEVKMIKRKHEKKYINVRFKIITAEQIFKI